MVKQPAISHPYTKETGPPKFNPVLYSVVTPVNTDIIENEKAKFENTLQIPNKTSPKHQFPKSKSKPKAQKKKKKKISRNRFGRI